MVARNCCASLSNVAHLFPFLLHGQHRTLIRKIHHCKTAKNVKHQCDATGIDKNRKLQHGDTDKGRETQTESPVGCGVTVD